MIKFNSTLTFSFIYLFIFRFLCVKDINCVILMDREGMWKMSDALREEKIFGEKGLMQFLLSSLSFLLEAI